MIRIPTMIAPFCRKIGLILLSGGLLTGVPALSAPPQQSADDDEGPASVSHAVVEPTAPSAGKALNAALGRLAKDPRNVDALLEAGNAAITLGDNEAALGFFSRADQFSPANATVKTAIAGARLHLDDPVEALRWYAEAERAGADPASFALDRGLAYDLVGDNAAAIAQYRKVQGHTTDMAMRDEATRREALSLAIGGDRRAADLTLLPLLQRQDRAAWRAHTFVLAIAGRSEDAVGVARATMPPDLADAIAPYLRFMVRLTPAQQAAVASLGRFPRAADIGRDDPRVTAYTAAHPRVPLTPAAAPVQVLAQNNDAAASEAKARRRHGRAPVAVAAAATRPSPVEPDIMLPPPPPPPAISAVLASAGGPPVVPRVGRTTTPARSGFDLAQVSGSSAVPQPAPTPPIASVVPRPTVLSRLDMPPPPRRSAVVAAPTSPTPISAPQPRLALAQPVAVPVAVPPPAAPAAVPVVVPPAPVVTPAVPAPAATPGIVAVELPASAAATVEATPAPPTSYAVVQPIPSAPERAPDKAGAPKPVHAKPAEPVAEPVASTKPAKDSAAKDKAGKDRATIEKATKDKSARDKPGKDTRTRSARDKADEASDAADEAHSAKDKASKSKAVHGKQAKDDDGEVALAPCKPAATTKGRKGKAVRNERSPAAKARTRHGSKGKPEARDNDTCAPTARSDRPDGPGDVSRDNESDDSRTAKGKTKGKGHDKTADSEKSSEKGGRHARYSSRIWVEVLTGADRDKMPGEWRTLVRKAHALKKHQPYLTPWRSNFRLLTGPFDSDAEAQDFIAELRKDGVSGFEWNSPAGQAVDRLALP